MCACACFRPSLPSCCTHPDCVYYLLQGEERTAEEDLSRRDPDRPTSAWVHGACSPSPSPSEDVKTPRDTPGNPSANPTPAPTPTPTPTPTTTQGNPIEGAALPEREKNESGEQDIAAAGISNGDVSGTSAQAEATDGGETSGRSGEEVVDEGGVNGGGGREDGVREGGGVVPDFRLNGFVYVCPLVSEGCTFTAKAWLQDEDD